MRMMLFYSGEDSKVAHCRMINLPVNMPISFFVGKKMDLSLQKVDLRVKFSHCKTMDITVSVRYT